MKQVFKNEMVPVSNDIDVEKYRTCSEYEDCTECPYFKQDDDCDDIIAEHLRRGE